MRQRQVGRASRRIEKEREQVERKEKEAGNETLSLFLSFGSYLLISLDMRSGFIETNVYSYDYKKMITVSGCEEPETLIFGGLAPSR